MDQIPIRFSGVTKEQLYDSLNNKTPITITTYYMGNVEIKFPIIVSDIKEYRKEIYFNADATTPDKKEWDCSGYILVSNNEGVMGATLKKP